VVVSTSTEGIQSQQPSTDLEPPTDEQLRSKVRPLPSGRFGVCRVEELRPHPSYERHQLAVSASQLSAIAEREESAFEEPLIVTQDGFIVDGYARWELAKRQGRTTLPCIKYELNQQDALQWLIQRHRRLPGLNDFIRIELALDLEAHFQGKALLNRQEGGRLKGLSKLTAAAKVDSRREIARVAHVSVGNVHKVKYILGQACSQVKEAVRTGEISINRADNWSHEDESKQLEYLRVFRIERGIRRKARNLVAAELTLSSESKPDEQVVRLIDFVRFINQLSAIAPERLSKFGSIEVKRVHGPGWAIFVTEELIDALTPEQKEIVR
jgi:hypothetical protein